jgi:OmpA-OmpF porin, OOP family
LKNGQLIFNLSLTTLNKNTMKFTKFYFSLLMMLPLFALAQVPVQPGNLPKDAQVDVSIVDAKSGAILNNEIVVFRSLANTREYQGLSDSTGKFSIKLPTGARYEVYILGFKDSIIYITLDIPVLKENQFVKKPISMNIQFEAPKAFVLDNCTFETGKAELKPEAYAVLDELVEYLKRKDDEKIELGGHTDNVGKADANMILSTNRANTVRAYLIMKGISSERVTAKGYGMTVPIAENDTAEGRALNRRTEVKIL